jgi:hexosaminidase
VNGGLAKSVAGGILAGTMLAGAAMAQIPANAQSAFVNMLMPQPAQLTVGSGRLTIGPGFAVSTDKFHDERLDGAIEWALQRLRT